MEATTLSSSAAKYDVYLSFRGEDTRMNFTDHLYTALSSQGIVTFRDVEELARGVEISSSLFTAIQESKISIILFSKGYASSRWCLDELVRIIECKNLFNQIVIPVFYRVDPSDVRHQTGTFGEAFARHAKFRKDVVQRWRTALTEAANISGFYSDEFRHESVLIQEIVKHILQRLNDMAPSYYENLVGLDSNIIEKIESLLSIESSIDFRAVGICGIGGVGKTTLAEAVFKKISSRFDASCFFQDVGERLQTTTDYINMHEKLVSTFSEDGNRNIDTPQVGLTDTKNNLSPNKFLVVFDDVTNSEQLKFLFGSIRMLASRSRIIITTRNKQALEECGVEKIYEIKGLSSEAALNVFGSSLLGKRKKD